MIVLPTRKKLERRRERLYAHLYNILPSASIQRVELIMRQIHTINSRLITYFQREMKREPIEIFNDPDDNDITTQDITTNEVSPSEKELAEIEAQIKAGGI